jgi:hypothetical protein
MIAVFRDWMGRTLECEAFFVETDPSLANEPGEVETIVGGPRGTVNVRLLLQLG